MVQLQQAADARAAAQSRVRLELLTELVRKDLKVKYKNSALGFIWSLANPLLYLAVFTLVFTQLLDNGIDDFPVLFMSGFLVWNFFNLATLSGTGSVVGNANLLIVLALFYRDAFGPQLVLLVPALAVVTVFATGMSLLASALNVRFRDVEHLLEVILLAWFWLTPIVYPVTFVRDQLAGSPWLFRLYMANPMAGVVTAMQRAIYVHPVTGGRQILPSGGYGFYLTWLGVAGAIALALLAVGLWTFRRFQADFAEEL
jgi:ABC-2 type transport system permease protein